MLTGDVCGERGCVEGVCVSRDVSDGVSMGCVSGGV